MPYAKDPASYPGQFAQAFEQVRHTMEELVIPCQDNREAKKLRTRMYSYRTSLDDDTQARYRAVSLQVREGCLIMSHQDVSREGLLIAAALDEQAAAVPVNNNKPASSMTETLGSLGFDSSTVDDPENPA